MFKLGEVAIPCDDDYAFIKNLCLSDIDWKVEYSKNNIKVWTKKNDLSSFNMIRVQVEIDDIPSTQIYDFLQDSEYRFQWDDRMVEGFEICYITPFSDIGYYSGKSPKPFKNRDFVTQRCWLDYGENKDKVIFNHSVNHAKYPPKKGFVRGISFLTANYIRANSTKSSTFFYVTQADPGGSLPTWVVNMSTKQVIPKMIKNMYKSCLKYPKWKASHNPTYKPWANPELIKVPKIDWTDIKTLDLSNGSAEDESQISEKDMEKNDPEDENNNY